jgi:hypothetical protein
MKLAGAPQLRHTSWPALEVISTVLSAWRSSQGLGDKGSWSIGRSRARIAGRPQRALVWCLDGGRIPTTLTAT